MKTNVEKKEAVDLNDKEGLLGKIPEGVESIAELMLWDSDVNVYSENRIKLKEEAFTIRGKKQKTKLQKEQIIVERRAQARAKYEQIKKEQEKKIIEAPLNIMNQDFGFRRFKEDDIMYRPEYKEATELQIKDMKIKGAKDFDAFNAQVRSRKQKKAEERR